MLKTSKRTFILFLIFLILATPVMATTPWTTKPPLGSVVNWSHPLSKGLVGCWLMNEGGGRKSNNLVSPLLNLTKINSPVTTTEKIKLVYANYQYLQETTANQKLFLNKFTIIVKCSIQASNASNNIVSVNSTTDVSPYLSYFIADTYTSPNYFRVATMTSSSYDVTRILQGTTPITLNIPYVIGFVYDPLVGQKIYTNGKLENSDSKTGNIFYYGTHYFNIGASNNLNRGCDGSIFYVFFYNRALSSSEIQRLYYEPYCFIDYKPWTMWGAIVAAARRIWIVN